MKIRDIVLLLFFATTIFAQVVVTNPEFSTENDNITIIFDATQGDGGLAGYTGTVYTHTGVNTNLGNWQHVIGTWGNNTTQPALTRIGTDLYQLVIGNPRTFYNVTNSSEHIEQLCFVFRSSTSTQTGRDVGGADIFVDLYETGLTVVFNQPSLDLSFGDPLRSPIFVQDGENLNVEISVAEIGTTVTNLTLYLNEEQITSTNQNNLTHTIQAEDFIDGANTISATASDNYGVTGTTSFVLFKVPNQTSSNLPNGTKPGITYNSDGTVTFALFAPNKDFCYIIGDFHDTDWKVGEEYLMNKYMPTSDSTIFWITLDNLTSNIEYSFQYLVDGEIRIADPYSELVLDGWNDSYISNSVYPNLKDYPNGKTEEYVGVFEVNKPEFNWTDQDFGNIDKTKLVIYELLIRDFSAEHTFQMLIDTLSYLHTLGVNAIQLMPVSEFDGNISWGYNPAFYFAVDKYYGPAEKLKEFVNEAHNLGIAVILDVVYNHSFGQSPFVRLYNEGEYGQPTSDNPWMNVTSPHPYSPGYDWNHESPHTRYFLDRVNRYWIEEFHIDGYRYDLSKGFTQTYSGENVGLWGNYDASRVYNLERMADKLWEFDPNAVLILEHFAENSEEIELSNHGLLLWGNMNVAYSQSAMAWLDDGNLSSDLSWGYYKTRTWTNANLVTYMESHDEDRLMYKNLEYGRNTNPDYVIQNNVDLSLQRQKLVGAFFFTFPGPKMIWQFGELGYDEAFPAGRTDPQEIHWEYYDDVSRMKLYKTWAALIKLRKEYDIFNSPYSGVTLRVGQGIYDRRIQLTNGFSNVTIIGNFDVTARNVNPNFQSTGKWYDFFSGDSITVTNTQENILLQPSEFHIYSTQKFFIPEQGILTDIENPINNETPTKFELSQNYPNPFNPSTEIKFSLPQDSHVKLELFNTLGEKVATLIDKEMTAGSHNYQLSISNYQLPSGVYFYKLQSGSFSETKKMILLK